jgi:hypothetical protein
MDGYNVRSVLIELNIGQWKEREKIGDRRGRSTVYSPTSDGCYLRILPETSRRGVSIGDGHPARKSVTTEHGVR